MSGGSKRNVKQAGVHMSMSMSSSLEISAPHSKCAALKCAVFKHTNGSTPFQTQIKFLTVAWTLISEAKVHALLRPCPHGWPVKGGWVRGCAVIVTWQHTVCFVFFWIQVSSLSWFIGGHERTWGDVGGWTLISCLSTLGNYLCTPKGSLWESTRLKIRSLQSALWACCNRQAMSFTNVLYKDYHLLSKLHRWLSNG